MDHAITILFIYACISGAIGAIALLLLAGAQSGFVGLVVYALAWAYLTTFMAVVSVLAGIGVAIWFFFFR